MPDFANVIEQGIPFTTVELDEGVDFVQTGDAGLLTIEGSAYGEGEYGAGPYGGSETFVLSYGTTAWTNVSTP